MSTASVVPPNVDTEAMRALKIIEGMPSFAWSADVAGRFTYVSANTLSYLGNGREDLNDSEGEDEFGWRRLVHPEDYDRIAAKWRHCLRTGDHYDCEHRLRRADGAYRWFRNSGRPSHDPEGRIVAWYGTTTDIHDQKLLEAELRLRESELSQLVDMVPSHLWRLSPEGEPTFFNKRMEDFLGFGIETTDRPGMTRLEVLATAVHPADVTKFRETLSGCLATAEPFAARYRLRRADGIYRWMSSRAEPLRDNGGNVLQWYGLCHDIDVQMRAEEALRRSERQLEKMVEALPVQICSWRPGGELTYINKRYREAVGVDGADFEAFAVAAHDLVHPDDADEVRRRSVLCLQAGEPFAMRYRRRSSGSSDFRWLDGRFEPLRDEDGKITEWLGFSVDIDDEVSVQESLRRREAELSHLVNKVPSLLWRLTADGEPDFFNRRLVEFLGFDISAIDRQSGNRLTSLIGAAAHPDDATAVATGFRHALATGESFSMRYRLRRADGVHRWVDAGAHPLRDDDGSIVQWFGFSHDIDDQMRLYSDIAERESRIRRLVDSDILGIVIWDLDGTLVDANDAFLRMVQYDRKDVEAGLRWFDMTPPEWQDVHAREEAEELAATGKMEAREKEYFRKDGSRVPVLIGAACFEGQSRQGVAYILDLTEQKRAERALRNRERELSQLVDMVPSHLWRITPEGEPVFFNKRLVDFLGLDVSGLSGAGRSRLEAFIQAVVHPDDALDVAASFDRSLASGERLSMRWRMRRADGVYRWMAASAEAMRDQDGRVVQWYGLCHDIDDQLQAEEALRSSKQQLEQMIDAVPFSLLSFDPSGKLTYVSKRYLDQAGSPPAGIAEFDSLAREVVHPEDFATMHRRAREGFATGQAFVNRFRRRRRDGGHCWIEARAQPLRDADGSVVQWYIASIDIEDEVRAQEALRERERFLWQLFETLPAMIDCAAPDGEPVYRSQQLREFLGFDLEEVDGTGRSRLARTLDTSVHPDDLAGVREKYAHSLATGEPYARRHRLRRRDGEYRWVETRAAPMRNAGGAIVQWNVICLDIDAEVRAQEQLRLAKESLARASQAAGLAELSASIAHEVNQPLAAVVANSHACQRWLTADPPNLERARRTVERIIRDANSAADVVSRIRALFRQSTGTRVRAPLSTAIAEARDLMADEAMRRRVIVNVTMEENLPPVTFDRVQIQQVLINLMRNGLEAMDAVAGARSLGIRLRRDGDFIHTEIADRGPGIVSPEKIFEPFFSTKEDGMGMGLAICRSIVESHGGRLWAGKNQPQGAIFAFTLPIEKTVAQ